MRQDTSAHPEPDVRTRRRSAPARVRLDLLVVDRGLAPSRERARALILAGQVRVDARVVTKGGTVVPHDAVVVLTVPDHPYVGRGGIKLAHALDVFQVDVRGRLALDIGASTGGFTDVLLQRGATTVVALDVGRGQLDWRLRCDPRVLVRERVNARALRPADLPHLVDVVTIDVSFISLKLILPVVPPLLTLQGEVIALVKPQFEAGRADVGRGGVVSDRAVHDAVVARVMGAGEAAGLECVGRTESPITGATGNREFFVHFRRVAAIADAEPGSPRTA